MSRILVVGPGYIGQPLSKALVADGHEVSALRRSNGAIDGVQLIQHDLSKDSQLELPHFDEIVFCLSPGSRELNAYKNIYVNGVRRVLDALPQEAKSLYFISSTGVYSENDGAWVDEGTVLISEEGTRSQILQEAESQIIAACENHYVFRFGGIYGPGRTRLVQKLKDGLEPPSQRPYYTNRIHQDDGVGVLRHFVSKRPNPGIYNVVDSDRADINDMISWARKNWSVNACQAATMRQGQNKRVSNRKLLGTGYRLLVESFRDSYGRLSNRRS